MQEHLDVLAEELRVVAQKYCDATGNVFTPDFIFTDITHDSSNKRNLAVTVAVKSEFSSLA